MAEDLMKYLLLLLQVVLFCFVPCNCLVRVPLNRGGGGARYTFVTGY